MTTVPSRTLRPYQAEAVEYLLQHPRAALFVEMRLGKSLITIRALQQLDPVTVLVVAPMAGIWAWKRELAMEGIKPVVLVGAREERRAMACSETWNLINYEGLRADPPLLQANWGAIVLDESRRIANPKAQITKVLLSYDNPSTRRIILSGNPAPEGPQEYFAQFQWLNGRFLGCTNYWQFRYCFFHNHIPFEWIPRPSSIDRIKKEVHSKAFVLTRKQAGVRDLKVYERRTVQMSPKTVRIYRDIRHKFSAELSANKQVFTKWVPVKYLWLQQLASGFLGEELIDNAKLMELLSLLQGELARESVVVWFRFNAGLLHAKRMLDGAGISNRSIYGNISPALREQAIDSFRAGSVRVLLCQIKATKEAIDLSTSSTAIYFSNSHSLDERVQSEDRILNPAKHEPLLYLDLVSEGTVDEDIVDLLADKKREARFFLSNLLRKLYEAPASRKPVACS